MTNRIQYPRSLSSPEGFFNFLPTSYIARPPRIQDRRSMTSQPAPDDGNQGMREQPNSQSMALSLVPRLVDHQSLRASWDNVVQETLNALTRVRNVEAPAHPVSMSSWLHSRSHHNRPSILGVASSMHLPPADQLLTPGGGNSASPSQSTANPNQVVLDLQYIDQNSTEDIVPLSNSNSRPLLSSVSVQKSIPGSPTSDGVGGFTPPRRSSAGSDTQQAGSSSNIPLPPPLPPSSTSEGVITPTAAEGEAGPEETTAEILRQNPEATAFLIGLFKYLPFVVILLAKAFYDHIYGIFLFVALFATFRFYNVLVKRSASQVDQQIKLPLLFGVIHLLATIAVFYLIYNKDQLYKVLIFVPPLDPKEEPNLVQLIWIIIISDFIIKLCTIIVKILLTLLPAVILPGTKRGKWYLFIELTSQFYRSLVPIQLWLFYLMESYEGHQKVVGVFLSAAYIVAKGSNIMQVAKAWWKSFSKLLDNIQLGVSPTKETLLGVGQICPICHDEFKTPVQLTCCHVFCEGCVTKWFDREQTCPLCRAKLVDDPSWRDGATSYFVQIF
uniref:RING finger and transmembrane domain-containing protein 2 n=1 Tax=Cacopsylla melanoneura TaxID=428564 RepID=A0A8D9AW57_9HEMI